MTWTLDGLTTTSVAPLKQSIKNSIAVHEITGADVAYTQATGKNNEAHSYELLLETADRATLKGYAQNSTLTRTLTDTVNGITAQEVKIQLYSEKEEAPGVWRINLTLIEKTI